MSLKKLEMKNRKAVFLTNGMEAAANKLLKQFVLITRRKKPKE